MASKGKKTNRQTKTDIDNDDHVLATTPPGFSIRQSTISNSGLGVFAETTIPKDTRLGPYDGVLYKTQLPDISWAYTWSVKYESGERIKHYVDASPKTHSSWIRYVNCANTVEEENLYLLQYNYEIYYVTYECVKPGTELLVWYGDSYGEHLGLHRTEEDYQRRFNEPDIRQVFVSTIAKVPPQPHTSKCFKFYNMCPFKNPPGSTGKHTKMCLPGKSFDVCRYTLCEENPCTNKVDCRPCAGYCFHDGKYIQPNHEFFKADNVNFCLCTEDGILKCTIQHSSYEDMCVY
ncbi:histone-lysine N-methyltransferase PRDM7-like [Mytilus edulis]|uniref:histone-lysine N-methyltransferase PRDM7-like n=1 Tax=Mytilus edulis TaxID=6550 RepID=UPI0039EE34AD